MTHQKQYTQSKGIIVPLTLHTRVDTNSSYASYSGGQIKMAPSREATLLRFSTKSAPSKKRNPLYPSCFISLASFKEIKVSILYMDRKELHFFSFTLTVHGKMYFSYENIWKECFQDLRHCALFTSQMLSQECVQIIKTTSPCIGILQSP